jgi:hypothetical protein
MVTPIVPTKDATERPYIRWSAREIDKARTDFRPLLDLYLDRASAQSATIYQFDPEIREYAPSRATSPTRRVCRRSA